MNLNQTQRQMVACSLEIDWRVDAAAAAGVSGHVSEFTYCGRTGNALSPKAVEREELSQWIQESLDTVGREATIAKLRSGERIDFIVDEAAEAFGIVRHTAITEADVDKAFRLYREAPNGSMERLELHREALRMKAEVHGYTAPETPTVCG